MNEQVFTVVSQTIVLSRPRVVKSVSGERYMGLPAGFVRPNRYVIFDLILHIFMV